MKMQAEIAWKKNEFKSAIRFAEKGRALYRELGKTEGEIACMYMISENAVRLSVKEGAKSFGDEPIPRQARDALEKGIKLAEAGIKLAKNSALSTAPELMGSLLCARAQGLTLKARFEEALACADEAVLISRDLLCYQLEANALMLSCDNLRALQQIREAAEAADEALALYRHVQDDAGENLALEVIATFQEYMQQQAPQFVPPPPTQAGAAPGQIPVWLQQQGTTATTHPLSLVAHSGLFRLLLHWGCVEILASGSNASIMRLWLWECRHAGQDAPPEAVLRTCFDS